MKRSLIFTHEMSDKWQ